MPHSLVVSQHVNMAEPSSLSARRVGKWHEKRVILPNAERIYGAASVTRRIVIDSAPQNTSGFIEDLMGCFSTQTPQKTVHRDTLQDLLKRFPVSDNGKRMGQTRGAGLNLLTDDGYIPVIKEPDTIILLKELYARAKTIIEGDSVINSLALDKLRRCVRLLEEQHPPKPGSNFFVLTKMSSGRFIFALSDSVMGMWNETFGTLQLDDMEWVKHACVSKKAAEERVRLREEEILREKHTRAFDSLGPEIRAIMKRVGTL